MPQPCDCHMMECDFILRHIREHAHTARPPRSLIPSWHRTAPRRSCRPVSRSTSAKSLSSKVPIWLPWGSRNQGASAAQPPKPRRRAHHPRILASVGGATRAALTSRFIMHSSGAWNATTIPHAPDDIDWSALHTYCKGVSAIDQSVHVLKLALHQQGHATLCEHTRARCVQSIQCD